MKYSFRNIKSLFKSIPGRSITIPIWSAIMYKTHGLFNKDKKIYCENHIKYINDRYFYYEKPHIYIEFDPNNEIQAELVEIIKNKLKILNELYNINFIHSSKLDNSNEPIVYLKNNLCLEYLNPFLFTKKSDLKLKEKFNNLCLYKKCDNYIQLREEFRYLENPKNKIIIVTQNNIDNIVSIYRDKYTKILYIENSDLIQSMNLKDNHLYIYYPPKLPYNMLTTELFIKELPDSERRIDFNSFYVTNPTSLMLKYNFFRDELKIDYQRFEKLNLVDTYDKNERIKIQKQFVYPKRYVKKLAEIDKKTILESWKKKNKHYLFIYVPNYVMLKEPIFEEILFKSSHLFDGIQICNSKNFALKHGVYDSTQISEDVPQIYLIETNNGIEKKIYSFNYFRFPDDFMKYLKNKMDVFKQPAMMENYTYVQTLNNGNFVEKVIKDNSFKEFLIEIKHEGCPTCFMLGKMFDHLSQKFKKHKKLNKLRFFRVDTHNDLNFLGEFSATPTYLFCRKNDNGDIEMITPIDKNEFLFKIKKLSKLDLNKIRYHPNLAYGFYIYQKNDFLKPNYDPDIDISGFTI